jgi:hypothetical protein
VEQVTGEEASNSQEACTVVDTADKNLKEQPSFELNPEHHQLKELTHES